MCMGIMLDCGHKAVLTYTQDICLCLQSLQNTDTVEKRTILMFSSVVELLIMFLEEYEMDILL